MGWFGRFWKNNDDTKGKTIKFSPGDVDKYTNGYTCPNCGVFFNRAYDYNLHSCDKQKGS
ncbi:MAG: hypothetical protein ACW9XA_07110 [Candidatus Nitrosopumilus sp. bin_6a]